MACKMVEVGNTLVTFWSGDPTLEDVDGSLRAALKMRDRVGVDLTLIGIFDHDVKIPVPGGPVARRMNEAHPRLMSVATNMQYVSLVGPGFTSARLISLLVSAFALTKVGRGRNVGIHRTITEALDSASGVDPHFPREEVKRVIEQNTKRPA